MALPKYKDEKAFVNVIRPVYAVLNVEDEDSSKCTYGDVKAIAPAMSVKTDPDIAEDTLYGDGAARENSTSKGKTSIEIAVNTTSLEFQAEAFGHTYENGVLVDKGADSAPYLAVGFALEKSNGKHRCYWFLKGRFAENGVDVKQKEDKVEFSTPTIKGNFLDRDDGYRKVIFDEDDANSEKAPWANMEEFLSAVPTTITTAKTAG